MKAELTGDNNNVLKCELGLNEQIFADPCATLWKSEGIEQKTAFNGGFVKGIGRALSGESMFLTTYTSEKENTEIAFSPEEPKKILEFDLKEHENIVCQKSSFFCANMGIKTSTIYTKQFGDSLFMQKIRRTGQGVFIC